MKPQPGVESLDLKQLLSVLRAVKKGDFSVRMPVDQTGIAGEVADTLNDVIELNERMAKEIERLVSVVGKEGRVDQRASLGDATGSWATCVDSVNTLIARPRPADERSGARHRRRRQGRPSQTMALEIDGRPLKGEFLRTAKIVNGMVEQLALFAVEVTRVAREVGTEGKLGGQANVKGVAGTWKDLTDNVNSMAGNLTGAGAQHRRGHDRRRQGRPLEEDHRRRARARSSSSRTRSTRWSISSARSPPR